METKYFSPEYWDGLINQTLDWLIHFLPQLITLLVLIFVTLRVFRFVIKKIRLFMIARSDKSSDSIESEKRINTLMGIIKKSGSTVIWIIFIMMFLRAIGIDIAPILAGAGIVGLAIGFGAQTLVKDVITGFFILLENQIRIGDVVTLNGTTGTLEEIQLRTIILRDVSGVVHTFETGQINTMANITKEWSAVLIDINVAYGEDTDKVTGVISEVADNLNKDENFKDIFIEPIEIFGIDKFDNSSVIIRTRLKTIPHEQWSAGREFRRRIKFAFDEKGIEMPYPHTSLYWGKDSKPMKMELINQTN